MNTTQTTVDVKRFLKEKIRDELVPALEQLVDELPDDLVGFSDAEQLLRAAVSKTGGQHAAGLDRGGQDTDCDSPLSDVWKADATQGAQAMHADHDAWRCSSSSSALSVYALAR